MKRPRRLSMSFVERVSEAGRYGDGWGGNGLSLLVKPRARGGWRKTFTQRLMLPETGKTVNLGLGAYPIVTLDEARAAALANKRAALQGRDPSRKESKVPTFSEAAARFIAEKRDIWADGGKSESQWRASLRDYALPRLGEMRVDAVTTADVLAVLTPIWNEKRETARRLRQRTRNVFDWAIAHGHRGDNPAGDAIRAALPKNGQRRQHMRALPHDEVAAALATVQESSAYPTTILAFEFLTLTAARSGEVRGATWDEIDLDAGTWTIPAERMKAGVEHRVPLSRRAREVLESAREYKDSTGLVFPSASGRQMSDSTISKLLRENGIECVPHGIRSSFRDWCAETGVDRELAESALAHTVKNPVEAAYMRSDLLHRRRQVIEDWGGYLNGVVSQFDGRPP